MQRLVARTTVRAAPETAFPVLRAVEEYPRYAEHLDSVEVADDPIDRGDGPRDEAPAGYELRFAWWVLSYAVTTRVTAVDPPRHIAWTVTDGPDANGWWALSSLDDDTPDGTDAATGVTLVVEYDPASVGADALDLPALVDPGPVLARAEGLLHAEGERVVERVVAAVEGEPRDVDLAVTVEEFEPR
ncbi:MAG: type II toxin-antitoxin system RatA family toxin [Halobacteriaceae archaeon]